eukprot:TRINITY_DN7187_c0_g1_i1.p1 TRINITY_DN7187_c0_g1~~TRINITY_DN7187_c0_g1_i1.p1  ORF type:complete len:1170 (+),score=295.93 TRINITY_DN7187_c0_g1_i1:127-3636(+)
MQWTLFYLKILLVCIPVSHSDSGCESSLRNGALSLHCRRSGHFGCEEEWRAFIHNGTSFEGLSFRDCSSLEPTLEGAQLPALRDLAIAGGRLRHFPGRSLPCSLQILDLGDNDIRSLPLDPFCFKNSLQGLSLARNVLKTLSREDFIGYAILSKLNLSGNRLNAIDKESFVSLNELRVLDLSHNLISNLDPDVLLGPKGLQDLSLSQNRLASVSPELFNPSLKSLNLSDNKLRSDLSFRRLPLLSVLDISKNEISNLHPSMLGNSVPQLQYLDISDNRLSRISLRRLNRLETVRLQGNLLERLDPEMFDRNMNYLRVLDLSANEIESIHPEAFVHCSALEEVSLEGNKLTYFPSDAIAKIPTLKSLNLGHNRIIKLSNGTFPRPMEHLSNLVLDENAIEEVGSDVFTQLPVLNSLNLSKNRIKKLWLDLFLNNKVIEVIRLDSNRLDDIVGLFKALPRLRVLNISNNAIDKFDWFLVPNSLVSLDLRQNDIGEIGNYFSLEEKFSLLEDLDVSHNSLITFGPKSLPKNLKSLSLGHNLISEIQIHSFIDMKHLSRVDLSGNQIKHLSKKSLLLSPDLNERSELFLGENPFVCDCDLEWLRGINEENRQQPGEMGNGTLFLRRLYPFVRDLDSITCLSQRSESKAVVPLVQSRDFLCIYKTHCYSLCLCCDFDACDCEMTCPTHCRCYHDGSWSVNIVDCTSAGLSVPPTAIPMDATEVYLQGNDFRQLTSHSFIGRKNLKILFLNSSNIEVILNNTFSGLRRLRILHLEHNRLSNLSGNEFQSLVNLKALYLEGNAISYIQSSTFSFLKELEILRLHDNRLATFHFDTLLSGLRSLKVLSLSHNPWNCSDCSWVAASRPWKNLIVDSFSCFDEGHNESSVCHLGEAGLGSSLDLSETRKKKIFFESYLPVFIVGGSFLIVLLVFCGVLTYYRQEIRILAFDWSGLRSNGAYNAEVRDYDVYVGYSAADDQWVKQILAVHLEEEEHYKLLLHQRDFHPHPSLADTIIAGAENASSLIFVISKHFISFEWSILEVRCALHSVLGRRKAIFLLLGDVSSKDLDPDLRSLIKGNSSIKRTDKLFWSRLRYRLPEPSSSSNSLNLADTFYTIPFPNEASTLSNHTLLRSSACDELSQGGGTYEQSHYFTLSSRLGQRVYDEHNFTPKFLDRNYK